MQDLARGFPETEPLTQLPAVIWSSLLHDLAPYLSEVQSEQTQLLTFCHPIFKRTVTEVCLDRWIGKRPFHARLAAYFWPLGGHRMLDEGLWQLAQAQDWSTLGTILVHPALLADLFALRRSDVKTYWTLIERHTELRIPQAYAELMAKPGENLRAAIAVADILDETSYPVEATAFLERLLRTYQIDDSVDGSFDWSACLNRLGLLYMRQGRYDESASTLGAALGAAQAANDVMRLPQAYLNLAVLALNRRRIGEAEHFLGLHEGVRQHHTLGFAAFLRGRIAVTQGRLQEAVSHWDDAQTFAEAAGDDALLGQVMGARGWHLVQTGEIVKGTGDLAIVDRLADRQGNASEHAHTMTLRGIIDKDRGHIPQALDQHRRVQGIQDRLGNRKKMAQALGNQGEALVRMGRLEEGERLIDKALAIFRQLEAAEDMAIALINRATSRIARTQFDLARKDLDAARAASTEGSFREGTARVDYREAGILIAERHYPDALELLDRAIATLGKTSALDALAASHLRRGMLLCEHLGRDEDALADFEAAIDIGVRRDMRSFVLDSLGAIVSHFRAHDELEVALDAAIELEQLAERYEDIDVTVTAAAERAEILFRLCRYDEALAIGRRVIERIEGSSDRRRLLAALHILCGDVQRERDDALSALESFRRAGAVATETGDNEMLVRALVQRARTLAFDLGRREDAAQEITQAMDIAVASLSPDDARAVTKVRDLLVG
jgi:tetratricopeptide (TPR) repeat protein